MMKRGFIKLSVYNLLTERDKNLIIKYIQCFGPICDNSSTPDIGDIENILSAWTTAKNENLEKLFNGNLILSRPYTYSIAKEGIVKEINDAIDKDPDFIYFNMKSWVFHITYRDELDEEFKRNISYISAHIFNARVLADNAYDGNNVQLIFPNGNSMKITKGMKPMKILHKLVEIFGDADAEKTYERFRNWHSMLLNQIHLDGTLSLSIHPLDYITMSDNGGSWSSCMHWQGMSCDEGPGDYRMGTVECMNSPYIIVAYLHNQKKEMYMPDWVPASDWSWNKKKWRELFIVRDGIITEIKGYPFQDENLTNTALMWLKDLAQTNLGWTYEDVEVSAKDEMRIGNKHYLFNPRPTDFMYNDFGTLKIHRARVNLEVLYDHALKRKDGLSVTEYTTNSYTENEQENIIIEIPYGGHATCMCCGDRIPYQDTKNNAVFCNFCEPSKVCPQCGEYFDDEGYYVSAYEDPICYSCFEYECGIDEISGNREINDTLIDIHLKLGEKEDGSFVFYENTISTLAPDYDNYELMAFLNDRGPKVYYNQYGIRYYYITIDMVKDTDELYRLFDMDDSYTNILAQYGLISADEPEN